MNQLNRIPFVIMASGLLCAGLIVAADASAADKTACSEDVARFCQNIKPGMFALMDCLEKNEGKLTSACKEYEATLLGTRVERSEKVREKRMFRQDCRNDMAKFCNDANPLRGGMLQCLNDHKKELSSSCSQRLNEIMD
ncbi:MAG: cysteine rich repeat-containing protein [Syntrophales bacterium]